MNKSRIAILVLGLIVFSASQIFAANEYAWISKIGWSPDGRWLTLNTSVGIWLYDAQDFDVPPRLLDEAGYGGFIYTPDSRYLVTANRQTENTAMILDVETGEPILVTGFGGFDLTYTLSTDGQYFAVSVNTGQVEVWDITSASLLENLYVGYPTSMLFSEDNRLLAVSTYHGLEFWDIEAGEIVQTWDTDRQLLEQMRYALDGSVIVSQKWDDALIWNENGRLATVRGYSRSQTAALSPDGLLLALPSRDSGNEVLLWNIGSGAVQRMLQGHSDNVTSVSFNADGSMLASASADGSVRVWDVASGQEVGYLQSDQELLDMVSLSPDGRFVAARTDHNRLMVWDVSSGELVTTSRYGRDNGGAGVLIE
jgi:WD40 repeat protein